MVSVLQKQGTCGWAERKRGFPVALHVVWDAAAWSCVLPNVDQSPYLNSRVLV
jgi:hypothetical protein